MQRGFMWFAWTPIWDKIIPFLWGISSKISINYHIIIYSFQIETSFVNLNPLTRNPGSAPASTIILFYLHGPANMGPIWNSVALPIWVPYRLLAGSTSWNRVFRPESQIEAIQSWMFVYTIHVYANGFFHTLWFISFFNNRVDKMSHTTESRPSFVSDQQIIEYTKQPAQLQMEAWALRGLAISSSNDSEHNVVGKTSNLFLFNPYDIRSLYLMSCLIYYIHVTSLWVECIVNAL